MYTTLWLWVCRGVVMLCARVNASNLTCMAKWLSCLFSVFKTADFTRFLCVNILVRMRLQKYMSVFVSRRNVQIYSSASWNPESSCHWGPFKMLCSVSSCASVSLATIELRYFWNWNMSPCSVRGKLTSTLMEMKNYLHTSCKWQSRSLSLLLNELRRGIICA